MRRIVTGYGRSLSNHKKIQVNYSTGVKIANKNVTNHLFEEVKILNTLGQSNNNNYNIIANMFMRSIIIHHVCSYIPTYLANTLNKVTISGLLKYGRESFTVCLPLNSILRAVPIPCTCIVPHSLHLSHPTQSMIRDMFLK